MNSADDDDPHKTRVFGLVRLFDRLDHAESFRAGTLRFRKLGYFRSYLDADGALRGDRYEGVMAIIDQAGIKSITLGSEVIDGKDLAGPILMYPESNEDLSVLCFYAITNAGYERTKFESLEAMKSVVQLPPESMTLGTHVVTVLNAETFNQRVVRAIAARGLGHSRNLVQYYARDAFPGRLTLEQTPFWKRNTYAHQREYRYALHTGPDDPCPYVLDVGDLSDITRITTAEEFNRDLTIASKDA